MEIHTAGLPVSMSRRRLDSRSDRALNRYAACPNASIITAIDCDSGTDQPQDCAR